MCLQRRKNFDNCSRFIAGDVLNDKVYFDASHLTYCAHIKQVLMARWRGTSRRGKPCFEATLLRTSFRRRLRSDELENVRMRPIDMLLCHWLRRSALRFLITTVVLLRR
jgi:hypothetical protein